MIPDIKLHEVIKMCLVAIRADYAANSGTAANTILYHLLNSTDKMDDSGKYVWLDQAIEIFITRDENHPKYLDSRLFFDRERASIPTIHVMMSGEQKGADGINFDEGFQAEQVINGTQRPVFNRQFDINCNIVCTSDNAHETVIIYHVIKSMLIAINRHIQYVGFINPVYGGRDITISQELVPSGIYARAISFSASYELSVPAVVLDTIISTVWIQMGSINGTTVTPPLGPGPITSTSPGSGDTDATDLPGT